MLAEEPFLRMPAGGLCSPAFSCRAALAEAWAASRMSAPYKPFLARSSGCCLAAGPESPAILSMLSVQQPFVLVERAIRSMLSLTAPLEIPAIRSMLSDAFPLRRERAIRSRLVEPALLLLDRAILSTPNASILSNRLPPLEQVELALLLTVAWASTAGGVLTGSVLHAESVLAAAGSAERGGLLVAEVSELAVLSCGPG